jgi:hypothetical protein
MTLAGGVCLLELLRFYAEAYVGIGKELLDLEVCRQVDASENEGKGLPGDVLDDDSQQDALQVIENAKKGFEKLGLKVCVLHANELLYSIHSGSLDMRDVRALHHNMDRELSTHFFVGVPESKKDLYCNPKKGWEEILAKFPSATEDTEEMNKCYALCRYSAAVFHSLLVVEHGLIALGKLLSVTDPKEGWDASCKKLASVVNAGHSQNSTGLNFAFLEQVNACIQTMKLAWRNKVNHASGKPIVMYGSFSPDVTEDIIAASRSFLRRLIEGIP